MPGGRGYGVVGLLAGVLVALASSAADVAPVRGRLDYGLQARQVAPDTYVFVGRLEHFSRANGGNIVNTGFIVTDQGVVVVDTGPSRLYGRQMRQAIAGVTDQPINRVYLTHHHPDHFLGNQAFKDVPILTLPETAQGIQEQGADFSSNMYRLVGDWMRGTEVVPPSAVVEPGRVDIGGHTLELIPLGGHTGGDLAVLDHDTGVLFAGDLVFHNRAPTTPHAHLPSWQASLSQLAERDFRVLVPGHGPVVQDKTAMAATRDYLDWLATHLRQAAEQGQDMAEVMHQPLPPRFRSLAVQPEEYMRSVSHLFPALERQTLGVPDEGH